MMKKTLAAFVALGALATAAAPAMAQPYGDRGGYDHRGPDRGGPDRGDYGRGDYGRFDGVRARVDAVLAKVDRALHSGRLSRSERASLSYRADKLSNLQRRYGRDGLNGWESAQLEREANDLDWRVNRAIRW